MPGTCCQISTGAQAPVAPALIRILARYLIARALKNCFGLLKMRDTFASRHYIVPERKKKKYFDWHNNRKCHPPCVDQTRFHSMARSLPRCLRVNCMSLEDTDQGGKKIFSFVTFHYCVCGVIHKWERKRSILNFTKKYSFACIGRRRPTDFTEKLELCHAGVGMKAMGF